jgi:hypothetical protein
MSHLFSIASQSEPRHLQWAFSRISCAAFLCLYFGLQALLFVKRTSSSSSLIGAAGPVPERNAAAGLTRKVTAEKIRIDRSIYGFSPYERRRTQAITKTLEPILVMIESEPGSNLLF